MVGCSTAPDRVGMVRGCVHLAGRSGWLVVGQETRSPAPFYVIGGVDGEYGGLLGHLSHGYTVDAREA